MKDILYEILIFDLHISTSETYKALCEFSPTTQPSPRGVSSSLLPSLRFLLINSYICSPVTMTKSPLQKVLFSSHLTYPHLLVASSF